MSSNLRSARRTAFLRRCGLALAGFVAAVMMVSQNAHASTWRTCEGNILKWNANRTTMSLSTVSFPIGSVWDTRVQNAMWHWNNVKGSGFNFFVARDTDGTHSHGNGDNEVYFSRDDDLGSALAVTFTRSHCYWFFGWHYGIDETDIGFNLDHAWNPNAFSYANVGSPYSVEGVALHELGHALGLGHESGVLATMNPNYPAGGPLGGNREWDPLGDDRGGVRILYPDGTTESDVAASAFKGTGQLVASTLSVARGGNATLEFTFSNLSTATKSFDINFYLSTNNIISTIDTLLGSNTGAWGSAGFSGTFARSLTIPSWVAPGTYHLGFVIDPANAVSENNESNNWQNAPRSITVF
jgi:Matrixin/CARDB